VAAPASPEHHVPFPPWANAPWPPCAPPDRFHAPAVGERRPTCDLARRLIASVRTICSTALRVGSGHAGMASRCGAEFESKPGRPALWLGRMGLNPAPGGRTPSLGSARASRCRTPPRSNPLLCFRVAQASKVSATTGSWVRTRAMAKPGSGLAGGSANGAASFGGAESVGGAASIGGAEASCAESRAANKSAFIGYSRSLSVMRMASSSLSS